MSERSDGRPARSADRARSFGAVAEAYDALRPGWPAPAARWLTGTDHEPAQQLRVLDLGAGTGKLTATLVGLGHEVLAVDPDPAMLDRLRAVLPGVGATTGTAEAIPLPDASVDAITVAQAWHWVEPVAATAECARVVRPGGVLGIGWHERDASVPWVAELSEIVGRTEDVAQHPRAGALRLPGAAFGPLETATFEYRLTLTASGLRDLADTWSYVRLAPDRDARLAAVLALGRRVAAEHGDPDGAVEVPHLTHCYRARRR